MLKTRVLVLECEVIIVILMHLGDGGTLGRENDDPTKFAHPTMPIVIGKADEKVVVHRLVLKEAGEEAAPFLATDLFPL